MSICQYCNSNHQSFCCEVTHCSTCCRCLAKTLKTSITSPIQSSGPCPRRCRVPLFIANMHLHFPKFHVLASGAVLSCCPTNRKGDGVERCGLLPIWDAKMKRVHGLISPFFDSQIFSSSWTCGTGPATYVPSKWHQVRYLMLLGFSNSS